MLTSILSDKRLSLNHVLMGELIIVFGNNNLWSQSERDKIIE